MGSFEESGQTAGSSLRACLVWGCEFIVILLGIEQDITILTTSLENYVKRKFTFSCFFLDKGDSRTKWYPFE